MTVMCAKHHIPARHCGCDTMEQYRQAQAGRKPAAMSEPQVSEVMSSNDLVTQLRCIARSINASTETCQHIEDGADHITTLKAENKRLKEALQYIRKNGFSEPRRGLVIVADTALKGRKG